MSLAEKTESPNNLNNLKKKLTELRGKKFVFVKKHRKEDLFTVALTKSLAVILTKRGIEGYMTIVIQSHTKCLLN